MKVNIKGTFHFTVRNADGSVKEELEFDNLITNSGMDYIAGTPTTGSFVGIPFREMFNTLQLSTNAVAPEFTDSAMGGTVVSTTTTSSTYPSGHVAVGSPSYSYSYRLGRRFVVGAATGTWSSVGLFQSADNVLFCRTLIKSGGIPVTLTIQSSESLDIRYELTFTPILTDVSGVVVINGTNYTYTGRPCGLANATNMTLNFGIGTTAYNAWGTLIAGTSLALGVVGGSAGLVASNVPHSNVVGLFSNAGSYDPETRTRALYSSGTYTRSFTYVWSNLITNASNVVNGFMIQFGGPIPPFQFVVSPGIPKGPSENLSLTFQVTWTRA